MAVSILRVKVSGGGLDQTFSLDGAVASVGRAPGNTIVVPDPRVSREHLCIIGGDDGFHFENVSRHNVVLLNGHEVSEGTVVAGDCLQFGDSQLTFSLPPGQRQSEPLRPDCITIDARDRRVLLAGLKEDDVPDLRRAKSDLLSLYEAGRVLNALLSSSDLCEKTLDLILAHVPAVDCCSLHLLQPDNGELECRASRFRSNRPEGIPHAFSRTMLNQVLAEKKSVLTFDALGDARFEAARSIASLSMRSAICVPIQVQTRFTGVLQAHTLRPGHIFKLEDLKLLTAFGMMVGTAIENAVLYERMDAEREAQEDRARMMQVMLHELKSPIAGVRMMAEMLRMKLASPEKQEHYHARIVTRLDNMLEWIKDTLNLSKLKSGELLGEEGRLDLGAKAREVSDEYREQALVKGLVFELDLPDDPICVAAPEAGIRLVLSNLISNAIKYTPQGRVTVALSRDAAEVLLAVSDSGIGIPASDLPGMCGEFFRASNARAEKIEGSGVGLASVKCIVERLGGTIGVESEEGQGTTVSVRLPLAP